LSNGTTTEHGTGVFAYRKHVGVAKAAFDRSVTDFDHRTATVNGTVTTLDPSGDPAQPAPAGAGITVRFTGTMHAGSSVSKPVTAEAVTAPDGTFAVPVTPGGRLTDGTVQVVGSSLDTDSVADAPLALPDVGTAGMRVRILGGPEHVRIHAGQSFRVAGTVQRLTPNHGWQPLVGAQVVTTRGTDVDYWNYTIPGLLGSGLSDAAGHFSYLAGVSSSTGFVTHARFSEYVGQAIIGGSVSVPVRASYTGLRVTIDRFREVQASGYLRGPCGHQSIQLQYSASGRSGWKRLASAYSDDKYDTHSCKFTVKGVGAVDGYYRIAHTESDQLLAFTSGAHHLYRIASRTSFSISPSHPSHNAALSASGTVTQRVKGKWVALRNARVVLVYRPKGDRYWYRVDKGTTSGTGHFHLDGKAYGDGYWGVYYNNDSQHYYSQAAPRYVDVR
ncbi:MAG: hypothetical protein JF597_50620, partial [Streptomyces sp.]|uniref:hypothetical protein n=1 Tax=Streptomyces sp. TaxID=1931 RepID=UPI0025F5B228